MGFVAGTYVIQYRRRETEDRVVVREEREKQLTAREAEQMVKTWRTETATSNANYVPFRFFRRLR